MKKIWVVIKAIWQAFVILMTVQIMTEWMEEQDMPFFEEDKE